MYQNFLSIRRNLFDIFDIGNHGSFARKNV